MLDLVSFTLQQFAATTYERSHLGWSSFFDHEKPFSTTTVGDLIKRKSESGRERAHPTEAVLQGFSLLAPWELLARTNTRRVVVANTARHVKGLVTQSMLISLISQNLEKLGAARYVAIRDIESSLVPKVISVRESDKAFEAFRIMHEQGVSGVAVVDGKGHLTDSISIRDLRGIGLSAEKHHRLWYEVSFFKDLVRQDFKKQTPEKPLWVAGDNSLEDVIRMMDDGNIHRIFVCERAADGAPIPTHVIAQRDVLAILLKLAAIG